MTSVRTGQVSRRLQAKMQSYRNKDENQNGKQLTPSKQYLKHCIQWYDVYYRHKNSPLFFKGGCLLNTRTKNRPRNVKVSFSSPLNS